MAGQNEKTNQERICRIQEKFCGVRSQTAGNDEPTGILGHCTAGQQEVEKVIILLQKPCGR